VHQCVAVIPANLLHQPCLTFCCTFYFVSHSKQIGRQEGFRESVGGARKVRGVCALSPNARPILHSRFSYVAPRFICTFRLRAHSVSHLIFFPACFVLLQAPRKKQRPKRSRNVPRSPRARRNPFKHRRARRADFSTVFAAAAAANPAASPRSHLSSLPLSIFPMVF
jgi:hypothetical protein